VYSRDQRNKPRGNSARMRLPTLRLQKAGGEAARVYEHFFFEGLHETGGDGRSSGHDTMGGGKKRWDCRRQPKTAIYRIMCTGNLI